MKPFLICVAESGVLISNLKSDPTKPQNRKLKRHRQLPFVLELVSWITCVRTVLRKDLALKNKIAKLWISFECWFKKLPYNKKAAAIWCPAVRFKSYFCFTFLHPIQEAAAETSLNELLTSRASTSAMTSNVRMGFFHKFVRIDVNTHDKQLVPTMNKKYRSSSIKNLRLLQRFWCEVFHVFESFLIDYF